MTTSKMKMLNKKDTYDQLALYRYADTTTEWLPCRILNRYRLSGRKSEKGRFDERPNSDLTEGFVVVFQDFSNGRNKALFSVVKFIFRFFVEKVLKHKNEVALVHDVNMDELEMIQISVYLLIYDKGLTIYFFRKRNRISPIWKISLPSQDSNSKVSNSQGSESLNSLDSEKEEDQKN